MSVHAIAWVKATEVGDHVAKLVLITLADYCAADWTCYPSQARIAKEAGRPISTS